VNGASASRLAITVPYKIFQYAYRVYRYVVIENCKFAYFSRDENFQSSVFSSITQSRARPRA